MSSLLFVAVDVGDNDDLEEADDDETDRAGEGVERLEPVLAGASTKHETDEEGEGAHRTCATRERRSDSDAEHSTEPTAEHAGRGNSTKDEQCFGSANGLGTNRLTRKFCAAFFAV